MPVTKAKYTTYSCGDAERCSSLCKKLRKP